MAGLFVKSVEQVTEFYIYSIYTRAFRLVVLREAILTLLKIIHMGLCGKCFSICLVLVPLLCYVYIILRGDIVGKDVTFLVVLVVLY